MKQLRLLLIYALVHPNVVFYLTAHLTRVGMNKYLFNPAKMIYSWVGIYVFWNCVCLKLSHGSIGMFGLHGKVRDKPDSLPDHREKSIQRLSWPLNKSDRSIQEVWKCCLRIQHEFTAGLWTCSLLTL